MNDVNILLVLMIVFVILQLADVITTMGFLKSNTGHEVNPIMSKLFSKIGVVPSLVIVKTLVIALFVFYMRNVVLLSIVNLFYAYVVYNNYKIWNKK